MTPIRVGPLSFPSAAERKLEEPEPAPPSEPARPPVSDLSTTGSARRIIRNVALRAGGETISKVASIVFFIAIARYLGTSEFGTFGFALSFTGAVLTLAALGTDSVLAREVARDERRIHEYLGDVVVIRAAMSVVFLGAVLAAMLAGGSATKTVLVVALVGGEVAIEGLSWAWQAAFQAYERQEFISLALGVQRVLTAAGVIAMLVYGGGLVAVSLVFFAGSLVGLAIAAYALQRFVVRVHWHFDYRRLLPLVRLGIPIGLASLLFTMLLRADVVILRLFKSPHDVGLYTSAMRLVEATMLISWFIAAAAMPWLARESSSKGALMGRGFELGVKGTIAVLMPIGVGVAIFAEPVMQIVYGSDYDGGVWPLRMLGVVIVFYGINYFTAMALTSHDRPGLFNRTLPIVVVQNLAANLTLIPLFGIKGAAVAAASSAVLLAALCVRVVAKEFGGVRVTRFLGGPLAGAGAMAACALLVPLPFLPTALLASIAYLAGFVLFEALVFPDELASIVRIVRRPAAQPVAVEPGLGGGIGGGGGL